MSWKASYQSQKNDFQIIGISEKRLKKTQETTTNIQFENYNIEHAPTESANKGLFQYIKKGINYKLRPDLMIYKKGNWSLLSLK